MVRSFVIMGAMGAVFGASAAFAQGYPSKPVRYIVPFAPSGTGDVCARYHAQKLQERMGQPVVVENRAGANQAIGLEAGAKSAPDGYTLVQGALSGLVLNTVFSGGAEKLPYDSVKDFAPVSMVCTSPLYLAVNAKLPVKTIAELVAYAKANPGKVTYSSNGIGGTQHLGVELLAARTGIKLVHVPYKNGAQSTSDMVSGVIDMLFGGALLIPQAKAGKVRILATGSLHRTKATPDVPTMAEAGLPGYDVSSWFSLVVPAGTPRPVIDRLYRETDAITRAASASSSNDIEYVSSTPEELGERIRTELQTWTKVIRDAGIKAE
jgi:tripartite-type tricarboxylate transporter receptor subunit TctC